MLHLMLSDGKEAVKKGMPTVLTAKKYFVRLCLSLTVISVFAVVASLVSQTIVLASSPTLGTTTMPNTLIPKGSVPKPPANPSTSGTTPNGTTCNATGTGGCDVTFSGTLAGSLTATVGTATITPPTTLDGTAQTAPFTFTTSVADTRGTAAAPWALSASSAGLTVNTIAGTVTDPFVITGVTATCVAATSCTNATIGASTGSLTTTAGTFASAPTGGDLGTTTITATGNVPLDPTTVGGAYSGTITITAGPVVTGP
ncbi:MAG: hypothetical protein JO011_17495 [Ktedonobacteraceae bacterium]|nr:hypothetical protein [Ktedonobacteraceae bacterium]